MTLGLLPYPPASKIICGWLHLLRESVWVGVGYRALLSQVVFRNASSTGHGGECPPSQRCGPLWLEGRTSTSTRHIPPAGDCLALTNFPWVPATRPVDHFHLQHLFPLAYFSPQHSFFFKARTCFCILLKIRESFDNKKVSLHKAVRILFILGLVNSHDLLTRQHFGTLRWDNWF